MSIEQERHSIEAMIAHLSDRVTDLQGSIESRPTPLNDDEQRWVRIAIQREAQSIEFRKAVISKTMSALLWSAIVAAAGFAWAGISSWLKAHGLMT